MYRIILHKKFLTGNLAGLTVTDSYTVSPETLDFEMNAATARMGGKVYKSIMTGAKYQIVEVEFEHI